MSQIGHTWLWLQSIIYRGCSYTHVFSVNLHFCFLRAHQSFLLGDGRGCSVTTSPSSEGISRRENKSRFSRMFSINHTVCTKSSGTVNHAYHSGEILYRCREGYLPHIVVRVALIGWPNSTRLPLYQLRCSLLIHSWQLLPEFLEDITELPRTRRALKENEVHSPQDADEERDSQGE